MQLNGGIMWHWWQGTSIRIKWIIKGEGEQFLLGNDDCFSEL